MRIGIATFCKTSNYGALLQAYSLQNYIRRYHDCRLIDYKDKEIKKGLRIFRLGITKMDAFYFINDIVFFFKNRRKLKSVRSFIKDEFFFTIAVGGGNYSALNDEIDLFISGSDQIWNPKLKKDIDDFYFGEGINKPKISYASSVGSYEFDNEDSNLRIINYLESYAHISVREKQTQEYLDKKGIVAEHVLDPVFLTKHEEWIKLSSQRFYNPKKEYIVIYAMSKLSELISECIKINKGKIIYVINLDFINLVRFKSKVVALNDLSPQDFLSLFINASTIITNSFHGTAFSIIFEKQANISINLKSPQRATSLLNLLGIVEISPINTFAFNNIEIQKKLDEEIFKSRIILDKYVNSIE